MLMFPNLRLEAVRYNITPIILLSQKNGQLIHSFHAGRQFQRGGLASVIGHRRPSISGPHGGFDQPIVKIALYRLAPSSRRSMAWMSPST